MKIAKSEYKIDELILCLCMAIFFLAMIIGAANFAPSAMFFPMFLCIPGFVLIVAYMFRGWLPSKTRSLMAGSDGFLEHSEGLPADPEDDQDGGADKEISVSKSYMLFGFTYAFILVSFLAGFYLSILIFLSLHLYFSRTFKASALWGNIALILVLLATVYVFDTAFGYHFNEGRLLSFP